MITLIICTYNREKYIGPLLDSIAKNNYPTTDYEIVLVDNNCTDNTRGVCEQFTAAHPEVTLHYVVEPEQGLSAARNKGINEAEGDFVWFVDSDDWIEPGCLPKMLDFLRQHPHLDILYIQKW